MLNIIYKEVQYSKLTNITKETIIYEKNFYYYLSSLLSPFSSPKKFNIIK